MLGIERDKARLDAGLDAAAKKVSEGDNLGSVKVPANSSERSKLEGERNSDALSPSRSGVNKHFEPIEITVKPWEVDSRVAPPEDMTPYV